MPYSWWPVWDALVRIYCSMQFTYEEDRLGGLSGVVSRFANRTGDQYTAGLWHSQIPFSLCWAAAQPGLLGPPRESLQRAESYRAPSWSWACIKGPFTMSYLHK